MPKLKKEDVIEKLKELEVEFNPKASYNDLVALLKEQEAPKEPVNEDGSKGSNESVPEESEGETKTQEEPKQEEVKEEEEEEKTEPETVQLEEKPSNPFSSFEDKRPLTGKAIAMRDKLRNQPKVYITIPIGTDELVGSTAQVTLNGYPYFIRKGMQVLVPEQVAKVLNEKMQNDLNVREHPLRVKGVGEIELKEFN